LNLPTRIPNPLENPDIIQETTFNNIVTQVDIPTTNPTVDLATIHSNIQSLKTKVIVASLVLSFAAVSTAVIL
jgi:hypothetical protein